MQLAGVAQLACPTLWTTMLEGLTDSDFERALGSPMRVGPARHALELHVD